MFLIGAAGTGVFGWSVLHRTPTARWFAPAPPLFGVISTLIWGEEGAAVFGLMGTMFAGIVLANRGRLENFFDREFLGLEPDEEADRRTQRVQLRSIGVALLGVAIYMAVFWSYLPDRAAS